MRPMTPLDAVFLLGESREHPMHVGGLMLFTPPEDAGPEYARGIYENLMSQPQASGLFRQRPARPLGLFGNVAWSEDDELDLDYHVRLNGLPQPGTIRDLLALVSRMHSSLLDRYHPLWEIHIIEGLADGRIAVYSKIHHGLLDGVSALRLLVNTLSDDPAENSGRTFWRPRPKKEVPAGPLVEALPGANALVGAGRAVAREAISAVPNAIDAIRQIRNEPDFVLPLRAPRTMFNVKVSGSRRFAAQSWRIGRLRAVAGRAGVKLNDVLLAMCSGALRAYLLEQNALPEDPLIAGVPVSTRSNNDSMGGNSVGLVLCNLGTDQADPIARLEAIVRSMAQAKQLLTGLTPTQKIAAGLLAGFPLAFDLLVPGYDKIGKPAFNLFISNVPGPNDEVYWNGAKLDGLYPVSVATDGQALNITVASRAGYLDFGLIGCRKSVPRLQRLLTHLEDSLAELERAVH